MSAVLTTAERFLLCKAGSTTESVPLPRSTPDPDPLLRRSTQLILLAACARRPDTEWVTQQARNLLWELTDQGLLALTEPGQSRSRKMNSPGPASPWSGAGRVRDALQRAVAAPIL